MSLQEALRAASEKAQQERAEKIKSHYVEYHSALYSTAASYDNAVILAGFAAFFALWAGTAEDIPRMARLITVALMGVSLMSYMAVTIGQMLLRQFYLEWRRGDAFNQFATDGDVDGFNKRWADIEAEWDERSGRILRPAMGGFWLSLGTGFAAGIVLTYSALGVAFGWPLLTG